MAVYVILGMLTLSTLQFALCAKTTCTASAGTKGEQATITCHFKGNVSQENDSVSVHKLGDGKAKKGSILDCFWEGDGLQCYNQTGYMYDCKDWRNLTVIIPAVTEKDVDQYVCQTMLSGADDHVPCELTLQDTSVSECRRESASNCTAPGDGLSSCCIVSVTLSVLFFLIALGTISFMCVVLRRCKGGRQTDRSTPNDTDLPFTTSPRQSHSDRVPRDKHPSFTETVEPIDSVLYSAVLSQIEQQTHSDEEDGESAHSDFETDGWHSVATSTGYGSIPSSEKWHPADSDLSDENVTSNKDLLSDAPVLDNGAKKEDEDSLDV